MRGIGDLSISWPLEAGNLYSSGLTGCSALCGEGSIPVCPLLVCTSSAAHCRGTTEAVEGLMYVSDSNLTLCVKLDKRATLKVKVFVMWDIPQRGL